MSRTDMMMSAPALEVDRLEFGAVADFLKRRWGLIFACTALWLLGAVAFVAFVTPTYTSTSQILIDPRKQKVFGNDAVNSDPALDSGFVDSQVSVLLSSTLLNRVVEREQLFNDTEFGQARSSLLRTLLDSIFGAPSSAIGEGDTISPRNARVIDRLRDRVDVQRVGKGNVLAVTVASEVATKSSRIANAIANAFLENQSEVRTNSVKQASSYFVERLDDLREQVRQSERAVADFRTKHNILSATSEGKVTVNDQQLAELNVKLATATLDTAEKTARYEQARQIAARAGRLEDFPDAMKYGAIQQLRLQQITLDRKIEELLANVGPLFPAVASLRAEREGIQRSLNSEVASLVVTLRHDADIARQREALLQQSIQRLSNESGSDTEIGVQLRELERANLANKAVFDSFLARAKQTQEQAGFDEQEARLISPALTPTTPSSPKIPLVISVALVMGLISGFALAGAVEFASQPNARTLYRRRDVEDEEELIEAAEERPAVEEKSPAVVIESSAPVVVEPSESIATESSKQVADHVAEPKEKVVAAKEESVAVKEASSIALAPSEPEAPKSPKKKLFEAPAEAAPIETRVEPEPEEKPQIAPQTNVAPIRSRGARGGDRWAVHSVAPETFTPAANQNAHHLRGALRLPDVEAQWDGSLCIAPQRSIERRFDCSIDELTRMVERLRYRWGSQIVLVTGDQKSATAVASMALAMTAADAGLNVLLVDGDAQGHALSAIMSLEQNPGLHDVLAGAAQVDKSIVHVGQFDLLPAGSADDTPAAAACRAQSLAQINLAAGYEWAIVDCPALWSKGNWEWLAPIGSCIVTIDNAAEFTPPPHLAERFGAKV